ncbi:hypothetical protein EXS72_01050 [Candidatus Pacearchaeota archaeon]|nr:hypothetical protein [Candidatus Pacearchaeota archaeon]
MSFIKEEEFFNTKHLSVFYLTFVIILSLSAFFYVNEYSSKYSEKITGRIICAEDLGCLPEEPPKSSSDNSHPTRDEIRISDIQLNEGLNALQYAQNAFNRVISPSSNSVIITKDTTIKEINFDSFTCSTNQNQLSCNQEELFIVNNQLFSIINLIESAHNKSIYFLSKYPGDPYLLANKLKIENALDLVSNLLSLTNAQLSLGGNQIIERAKKKAKNEILVEEEKEETLEYYAEQNLLIPPTPFEKPKYSWVIGTSVVINSHSECNAPVQDIIYNEVKRGVSCINSQGQASSNPIPPILPYISNLGNLRITPSQNIPNYPSFGSSSSAPMIFLIDNPNPLNTLYDHEAFTISKGKQGVQIGFLLAPTHVDLENKINAFINNFFFDKTESKISKVSATELKDYKKYSRPVPWFLWIILASLITSFLFLEILKSFKEKSLFVKCEKSLIVKDFNSAIRYYNLILESYEYLDNEMKYSFKQRILKLSSLLNRNLKNSTIPYEINYSTGLPKIVLKNNGKESEGYLSHEARIKKIIEDTTKEIGKNRKLAIARLPLITKMYNQLENSSKKRLAQIYENFIYKLRKN